MLRFRPRLYHVYQYTQSTTTLFLLPGKNSRGWLLLTCVSKDGVNRGRSEEEKGRTKRMANIRCYSALARSDVIDKVHHYSGVPYKSEPCPRSLTWPSRLFQATHRGASIKGEHGLRSIVSFSQTPKWYSPSSTNMSQPHVDLMIARFLHSTNSWHFLDTAWLSCLFSCGPMLVWPPSSPHPFAVVGQITSQAALGWPVTQHAYGGAAGSVAGDVQESDMWFELNADVKSVTELKLLFVVDPDEWQAQAFSFTSPATQCRRRPLFDFAHGRRVAIRMEPKGLKQNLLQFAAGQAFGKIAKPIVTKLLKHLGMEVMSGEKLFDLLWSLLQAVLPTASDDDLLAILGKRTWKQAVICQ